MKLQYLGDSKDCFKWDYHDYLVNALDFKQLKIVLMMTPDDGGTHGNSHASLFPGRSEVVKFCSVLKERRKISLLHQLPEITNSAYEVDIHSEFAFPETVPRSKYFDGLSQDPAQLILVDPDNGFEPKKSFSDKHLRFSELDQILEQIPDTSVISVFQHFRRVPFKKDFLEIRKRIHNGYAAALYWHSLMFVQVTQSLTMYKQVCELNEAYASEYRKNKQSIFTISADTEKYLADD